MTANTTDVYSGKLRQENSDEIDLRRYFLVLTKWWREILAISILGGVIGGIAILLLNTVRTPVYSASADVVIARLATNIELDDRVSTSSGSGQTDQNGWRASLLQLAKGSDVANAVLADLKNELPAALNAPDLLIGTIDASIPTSPDERFATNLIRITSTTSDPVLSANITNSWARHLVEFINGLYGEVPQNMLQSVTDERDTALDDYKSAEKAYEDFVANNQIDMLTRQIQEKSALRDGIMGNYTNMLTSAVSAQYNAQIQLYNALTNAPTNHAAAILSAQSDGNIRSLNSLYGLRAEAMGQLDQARNMQRSLEQGGEAAAKSNIIALQLLKLSTFATMQNSGELPGRLSLEGMGANIQMSQAEQLTDVGALVSVLEEYLAQLDGNIEQIAGSKMVGADPAVIAGLQSSDATTNTASISTTIGVNPYAALLAAPTILGQEPTTLDLTIDNTHEPMLAKLETEIRALQAEMASETAIQQELTHRRDLAWTTYDTVGNKLQELVLLRSSANSEVRLGNPALVPVAPEPKLGFALPIAALTILAFCFAVVLVLVADALGAEPFFSRRPAIAGR